MEIINLCNVRFVLNAHFAFVELRIIYKSETLFFYTSPSNKSSLQLCQLKIAADKRALR